MNITRKKAEERVRKIEIARRATTNVGAAIAYREVQSMYIGLVRDLIDALPPDRPFHACDKCGCTSMQREGDKLICDWCGEKFVLLDFKEQLNELVEKEKNPKYRTASDIHRNLIIRNSDNTEIAVCFTTELAMELLTELNKEEE